MPLPGPVLYAGSIWIGPPHPENYFAGRLGYGLNDAGHPYSITAIGLHHTAATLQGAIDTFKAAPASGRQHSAHFIVDLDGSRYQILDTADTAFALGDEAGNCQTVNIEVVQTWDFVNEVKTSDFTDAQYASVSELCQILAKDSGFAVDADHVHGHNFWTPTTCPADLDVVRVIQGDPMALYDTALLHALGVNPDGTSAGDQLGAGWLIGLYRAIGPDVAAILAAIADLKAHPAGTDPTVSAIVTRIENALKQA